MRSNERLPPWHLVGFSSPKKPQNCGVLSTHAWGKPVVPVGELPGRARAEHSACERSRGRTSEESTPQEPGVGEDQRVSGCAPEATPLGCGAGMGIAPGQADGACAALDITQTPPTSNTMAHCPRRPH